MRDKIIQIVIDSEGAMTGLGESGKLYDFIPQKYLMENNQYVRDEKGNLIIDLADKAHWKFLIDSPRLKGGEKYVR